MVTNGPTRNDLTNDLTDTSRSDVRQERQEMRESRERLVYDFKEMVDSAEALLRSTAKYTGAEIDDARERLQAQLDMARDRSGDVTESLRDVGKDLATRTDECVHKHPWQCIGIAFVAGMIFTHCTRSRN